MGKAKKPDRGKRNAKPYSKPLKSKEKQGSDGKERSLVPSAPTIPFACADHILLVG